MARSLYSSLEVLESRIAPSSLVVLNPLPNITAGIVSAGATKAGIGNTGATIDLNNMFAAASSSAYDTEVTFTLNFKDPSTGKPATFTIDLFDNLTPATVQNFLSYIDNPNGLENFVGTFFHRDVTTTTNPGTDIQVLQGGGYDAKTPSQHIPTGPTAENEFQANDPQLSNVAGTVAMAKTGLGPNTATSEFFVNLADNSANLDQQNGGFTVFGKITAGMDILQDIANLPNSSALQKVNGALTNVPIQGTLPSSGIPGQANLVTITDAQIAPVLTASATGYTYTVSVADHLSTGPSQLFSSNPTVTNGVLQLNYAPGAVGEADVTVTVTDANHNTVTDTFTVTVEPNLIVNSVSDTFHDIVVPGDSGKVKFTLTNNAASIASGKVAVDVYLAPINSANISSGAPDLSGAVKLGTLMETINLASGASKTFTGTVQAPILGMMGSANENANGGYQIIEVLNPIQDSTGSTVHELYSNDRASVDGAQHAIESLFGNFSAGTSSNGHPVDSRVNVPLQYMDSNSHLVTLKYTGDGAALLVANSDGTYSIETGYLGLAGNAKTSVLSAKVQGGGTTNIEDFTTFNSIGKIQLGSVNISGDVTINQGAGSIIMGDLNSGGVNTSTFTLDGSTSSTTVKVGAVSDYSFTANAPLKSLSAGSWIDNNANPGSITLPQLGSLNIAGELEANFTISGVLAAGSFVVGGTLEKSTVSLPAGVSSVLLGAMDSSNVTIGSSLKGGAVQTFSVDGSMTDSTVQITNNVNKVTIGAMDTSNFFVGVSGTAVPTDREDFTGSYTVGSFTLKGVPGVDAAMKASNVAAPIFKSISIASVDGGAEASNFGVVTESIAKYVRFNGGGAPIKLTNPPAGIDPVDTNNVNFVATVLLQD